MILGCHANGRALMPHAGRSAVPRSVPSANTRAPRRCGYCRSRGMPVLALLMNCLSWMSHTAVFLCTMLPSTALTWKVVTCRARMVCHATNPKRGPPSKGEGAWRCLSLASVCMCRFVAYLHSSTRTHLIIYLHSFNIQLDKEFSF